jgi:glycosyltransferase involved in cell wall biosynthesis
VRWAASHPDALAELGRNARAEYEAKYTPERNLEMLLGIYERAIEQRKAAP